MLPSSNNKYDIVVFGATGDTGSAACSHLFYYGKETFGINSWACAARNLEKLENTVLEKLRSNAGGHENVLYPGENIFADSNDYESLVAMCEKTKVVLACAGPYAKYGELVVKACVASGTHYVDVTGEVPWVSQMSKKYGKQAVENQVCVVSMAGYDSVPPDLLANLSHLAMGEKGETLGNFECAVGGSGGAVPTGTINTVLLGINQAKQKLLHTVSFGLLGKTGNSQKHESSKESNENKEANGKDYISKKEKSILKKNMFWNNFPSYSFLLNRFSAPHFMAMINTQVVHHTAERMGYGGGLRYRERLETPSGIFSLFGLLPTASAVGVSLFFGLLVPLPFFDSLLLSLVKRINATATPRLRNNLFNKETSGKTIASGVGVSKSGKTTVEVRMESDFDPGLGFTMLSACAVASSLAKSKARDEGKGFSSAVVALGGDTLKQALSDAGVRFDVSVRSKL